MAVGMGIIPPVSRHLPRDKPLLPRYRKPSAKRRPADMPVMGLAQILPLSHVPIARKPLLVVKAEALILGTSPLEKIIKVKITAFRKRCSGCAPIDKS
jgi:hypothetical protein